MSTCLRSSALACLMLATFAQTGTAGMVGFTVSPTTPAPDAALETKADGSIVGTNINVTVAFGSANATSTPTQFSIGAYLDFSTGSYLGTDANGNKTYSNANANFFILGGPLEDKVHGAGSSPLAFSVDLLTTVASPTTPSGEYQLTATVLSAFIDPTIAQSFGLTGGSTFAGTFNVSFIFDSTKAGDQVAGGGIILNQNLPALGTGIIVPAPPSLVLSAFGLVGMTVGQLGARARGRKASTPR